MQELDIHKIFWQVSEQPSNQSAFLQLDEHILHLVQKMGISSLNNLLNQIACHSNPEVLPPDWKSMYKQSVLRICGNGKVQNEPDRQPLSSLVVTFHHRRQNITLDPFVCIKQTVKTIEESIFDRTSNIYVHPYLIGVEILSLLFPNVEHVFEYFNNPNYAESRRNDILSTLQDLTSAVTASQSYLLVVSGHDVSENMHDTYDRLAGILSFDASSQKYTPYVAVTKPMGIFEALSRCNTIYQNECLNNSIFEITNDIRPGDVIDSTLYIEVKKDKLMFSIDNHYSTDSLRTLFFEASTDNIMSTFKILEKSLELSHVKIKRIILKSIEDTEIVIESHSTDANLFKQTAHLIEDQLC